MSVGGGRAGGGAPTGSRGGRNTAGAASRPRILPALLLLLPAALWLAACGGAPELPRLAPGAVILAFGDSLTHGTGAKPEESYPAVLERLTGHRVVNAGVPGEVSAAGLARLPGVMDRVHPDLLILCHGGNDILRKLDLDATERNLRAMVALARERGVPVVLIGVPRFGLFLDTASLYEDVARDLEVPIEDEVLPEVLEDNALKSDTVHPNAEGYRRIAGAVARLLRERGALE